MFGYFPRHTSCRNSEALPSKVTSYVNSAVWNSPLSVRLYLQLQVPADTYMNAMLEW